MSFIHRHGDIRRAKDATRLPGESQQHANERIAWEQNGLLGEERKGEVSEIPFGSYADMRPNENTDWQAAAAQEHDWHQHPRLQWRSCRACGIVERRDGKNRPCPGKVNVTLRATDNSPKVKP